jgi:hypothetical protein
MQISVNGPWATMETEEKTVLLSQYTRWTDCIDYCIFFGYVYN